MKKIIKNEQNRIFVFVFIITMLVACSPLITKYCINGHDLEYHLLRIEALKEGILAGKPFLKVNMLFFGGAGYASSMFYPDFLLYIPAVLRVVGFGINTSYHLFICICIILCFLSTYYSVNGITKDRFAGLAAAIILCLSNYFLDDIYVRSAVGEITAFIFIPFILYGIYNTLNEEMDKPYVLGVGFAGLLLCHTLSFILCFVLTVAIFVICIKKFIVNPKVILKLIVTAFVSAGVTCTYWLPMLEQFLSDRFYVSVSQWMDPSLEALQVASGLGSVFPCLGVSVFVFCLPIIILNKNEKDNLYSFGILLILASTIMFICSTDIFPWKRFGKYLATVQFPWRLYTVASVCLAIASAIVLKKLAESVNISKLVVFENKNLVSGSFSLMEKCLILFVMTIMIICSMSSMSGRNIGYYDYSDDYYSYKPYTANVIAGEWLPETVQEKEIIVDESENAVSSAGTMVDFIRSKNEIILTTSDLFEYVDVPFIFYKGYSAVTDSGIVLNVDNKGNNGFLRVYPGDYIGKIRVFYKGTILQHIASGITLGCLSIVVLAFIYVLYQKRRGNK